MGKGLFPTLSGTTARMRNRSYRIPCPGTPRGRSVRNTRGALGLKNGIKQGPGGSFLRTDPGPIRRKAKKKAAIVRSRMVASAVVMARAVPTYS